MCEYSSTTILAEFYDVWEDLSVESLTNANMCGVRTMCIRMSLSLDELKKLGFQIMITPLLTSFYIFHIVLEEIVCSQVSILRNLARWPLLMPLRIQQQKCDKSFYIGDETLTLGTIIVIL
ncbi:hypothetical protein Leryth_021606 [Lithospermum erythrorhizon]|nr:hypothetical protein Leryth_021606 [Lithospermum erythrorhizon]